MEVTTTGTANAGSKRSFKLRASTRTDANTLIDRLTDTLRVMFSGRERTWTLHMDISGLRKIPSIQKLKRLTSTLDELQPQLVRQLRQTTIVCSSKLQRMLIALVFKIHPPATPISVETAATPSPSTPSISLPLEVNNAVR